MDLAYPAAAADAWITPPAGSLEPEMAALFPRWTTPFFRLALVAAGALALALPLLLMAWVRTPASAGQFDALPQPIAFDHQHHVVGYEIDCRYCHFLAERSPVAGVPPTETCVPCHNATWYEGPFMEPVRRSLESGLPIEWQRVHRLPDFVFFDHSIHVTKGIGCETCHGRVDQMPRVYQAASLSMAWCLECHRRPERYVRPVEAVTVMGWSPARPQAELGPELVEAYGIRSPRALTTCTACHR
jgi:hypothetical protein